MPTKVKDLSPPTGLSRILFRLPIWLFRLGLGGLLGKRFVLVNHIGRKSSKLRQAVLEVVDYDKGSQRIIVAAGFGEKTAWYQNLLQKPETTIQLAWKKMDVVAEQLTSKQSGDFMLSYAKAHPPEARVLAKFMGYEVDGSDEDWYALGEDLLMVTLTPR